MHSRSLRLAAALVAAFATAVAAAACGDTAQVPSDTAASPPALGASSDADAVYEVSLHPLNARAQNGPGSGGTDAAQGVLRGKATFTIQAGSFDAAIEALGAQPGMIHPQHVHAADRCPSSADDVNHDGYVDVIEGLPDYGPILIPLDSHLETQAGGTFPTAFGPKGQLSYHATADFAAMLADLNAPDPDPTDAVVKLNGQPLALETRHVVIHGVDPATPLPATVASLPGVPAYLTLPIACGEIRRVR